MFSLVTELAKYVIKNQVIIEKSNGHFHEFPEFTAETILAGLWNVANTRLHFKQ